MESFLHVSFVSNGTIGKQNAFPSSGTAIAWKANLYVVNEINFLSPGHRWL